MLLAVDIGNSHIKFGIFDGDHLLSKFSAPTNKNLTASELGSALKPLIEFPVKRSLICSVVPEVNGTIGECLTKYPNILFEFVTNDFDFGLKINYEPLSAIGTDRLVNAFSASEKYGTPSIVCSFGTATTIDVVSRNREFLGGVIAPGMKTLSRALHLNASQLPEIEIKKPVNIIGRTTRASIESGIFYGHLGTVEGIIARLKTEIDDSPKVIATGGFASMIADNTDVIDVVDENLLLDGLRLTADCRPS